MKSILIRQTGHMQALELSDGTCIKAGNSKNVMKLAKKCFTTRRGATDNYRVRELSEMSYGTQHKNKHINLLETVQNKFLKYINFSNFMNSTV